MNLEDEILYDIYRVLKVEFGKECRDCRRIYPNTNEDLNALFKNFTVKDKDVFSVLGSSDQVLSCFYLGAKNVDSFDINKLTIYYYYLRKWLITYLGEEYINKEYFKNGKHLIEFIVGINPISEDENKAKLFWLNYLSRREKIDEELFLVTHNNYKNVFDNDLENLSHKIKDLKFYNYDFSKKIVLNKKYDVIILSNILECLENPKELLIARDNIENLLKDDSICVCSHVMETKNNDFHKEEIKVITSGNLIEEDFEDYYEDNITNSMHEVGYVYKKRQL